MAVKITAYTSRRRYYTHKYRCRATLCKTSCSRRRQYTA